MQFKKGSGWKACYDEERNLYTAETWDRGTYHLYEIDAEAYARIGTPECDDWDSDVLIRKGRHLYMDVDDGYSNPYSHVFDENYATLCPWARIQNSGHQSPSELTNIGVQFFENEKTKEHWNNQKQS